jgi:hypothetical protein
MSTRSKAIDEEDPINSLARGSSELRSLAALSINVTREPRRENP